MNRQSRYSQSETAGYISSSGGTVPRGTYHDVQDLSPELEDGVGAFYHGGAAQAPHPASHYRGSLDLPPRGYGHGTGYGGAEGRDRGYDNPFEARAVPEEDEIFNVEDDFNNVGPRYAELYGANGEEVVEDDKTEKTRPKS
jgi:hypothetical protein